MSAIDNSFDMNVLIENNLKPKKQQLNNLLEKIDLTSLYNKKDSLLIDSLLPTLSSNGSSSVAGIPVAINPIIPPPSQSNLPHSSIVVDNYYDGQLQSNLFSMLTGSSISTNPFTCNSQQQQSRY